MPLTELVGTAILVAIAWLWYDSVHVRDLGIRAAKAACAADDLQLLDDTVAFIRLGLARDDEGRLRLRRAYSFDFSDTGNNRRRGSLVMLGEDVLVINTGPRLVASEPTLH